MHEEKVRIPERWLKLLLEETEEGEMVFTSAGGNVLHCKKIEIKPDVFCWDFQWNPYD